MFGQLFDLKDNDTTGRKVLEEDAILLDAVERRIGRLIGAKVKDGFESVDEIFVGLKVDRVDGKFCCEILFNETTLKGDGGILRIQMVVGILRGRSKGRDLVV